MNRRFRSLNRLSHIRKAHGVVSIEFAIGFFFFILMFFAWAEIAYIGYISGLIDYTLAETARDTRAAIPLHSKDDNTPASEGAELTYKATFNTILRKKAGIWGRVINFDKFKLTVSFYKGAKSLGAACDEVKADKQQKCFDNIGTLENEAPIALYQAQYDFSPLFYFWGSEDLSLKREVFVVQEYERNKFHN